MWNKLFKKKQSKSSNKSQGDVTKQTNASSFKCFSFRSSGKPSKYNENFDYFQYESEVYKKPGFDGGHEYSQLYQPEQHQEPGEHQQLNEIFIEIPQPNIRLDLCPVCSRKFSPESLMKHVIICEKINTKKRKPFVSAHQRLNGTEFTAVVAQSPILERRITPARISPPKTLQRKASEVSLRSVASTSADRYTMNNMSRKSSISSLSSMRPFAKRSMSVTNQSEKCPFCERNFGFKAYDRHVEWCKEKALIKPSPDIASVSAAKERMKTRINYKAPNLRTKRSTTRDKYSSSCNGSTNSLADFDSHLNSMNSSMTSDNGLYDPFLSAKKQLEELFSPTTTPTTQMINSMMSGTPSGSKVSNDIMSKSLTLNNINHVAISPKTPQPIPKMQSNFKRTSSLRISNRSKPKPMIYTPPVKSNIHCGISPDEGPISPNFVKATDYDELPIKSPYSAIKMCENQIQMQVRASPSPTMPSITNPLLRDKNSALIRKTLKLDLKNPNLPSADYPLSKTDSLALFLKYENELTAKLSEKEMKDKSNSLSKRSLLNLGGKLPDINGHQQQPLPTKVSNGERPLISIDNFNKPAPDDNNSAKSHSAPVKSNNACDNLPLLTNGSDKSRSPSIDRKTDEDSPPQGRRSGSSSTLRRQMKYNMDNVLFDTEPSSSDNSNNNSLKRPESRTSNTETIFEDFDFDQFIASFTDDDKFPIFKDYKTMMNKSPPKVDNDNNNKSAHETQGSPKNLTESSPKILTQSSPKNIVDTKPIPIQKSPGKFSEAELSGLEKLDNLCKMLSGNSDSDESNSLETDRSELQTARSKSSADSAYGRQSQSPFDHRNTIKPTPPPRKHLELKTTEIVLNPVKPPNFQESVLIPKNGNVSLNRSNSTESSNEPPVLSKFCHECGYKFVVPTAKFCIECGVRRVKMA